MAGSRTGRTQWARGRTTAGAAGFGSLGAGAGAGAGTGVGEGKVQVQVQVQVQEQGRAGPPCLVGEGSRGGPEVAAKGVFEIKRNI